MLMRFANWVASWLLNPAFNVSGSLTSKRYDELWALYHKLEAKKAKLRRRRYSHFV